MQLSRVVACTLLALSALSCVDARSPTSVKHDVSQRSARLDAVEFASQEPCDLAEVTLDPLSTRVAVGGYVIYRASVVSRGRQTRNFCNQTAQLKWSWTFGTPGIARLGAVGSFTLDNTAEVHGEYPGSTTVTAVVSTYDPAAPTASKTASLTVYTPPPPPTVVITGPTTISQEGEYTLTVESTGGDNMPGGYTYQWERNCTTCSGWTVVRTVLGDRIARASFHMKAGEVHQFRVRAYSGESLYGPLSPVFTVDATNAVARPLVTVTGDDNIRMPGQYTWEATPSGGNGTYSYLWQLERPDGTIVRGTSQTFSWTFDSCDGEQNFPLSVTVTSGGVASIPAMLNVDARYPNGCRE